MPAEALSRIWPRPAGPGLLAGLLTVAGLVAYAVMDSDGRLAALCGQISAAAVVYGVWYFGQTDMAHALLLAWSVMTLIMMPVLSWPTARHIWQASLPRRRRSGVILYTAGYIGPWLLSGLLLIPLFVMVGYWVSESALPFLAVTLIWTCTPIAQRARNLCHRLVPIRPFGNAFIRDCLAQGLLAGAACIGVCWPLMLQVTAITDHHLAAMVVATLYALAEKSDTATPPRWRLFPGPDSAMRLGVHIMTRFMTAAGAYMPTPRATLPPRPAHGKRG